VAIDVIIYIEVLVNAMHSGR